jgi:hypothetical protein
MMADADAADALAWTLTVLALADELVPPEPARLGPVLRHRQRAGQAHRALPFSIRWRTRHVASSHRALWSDR